MYQASVGGAEPSPERQQYDFSPLEAFAREEKARLGIQSPAARAPNGVPGLPPAQGQEGEPSASGSTLFTIPRARHRKLSHSAPTPRRGKLAMFEQGGLGTAPPTSGTTLSAVPSYENVNSIVDGAPAGGAGQGLGGMGTGHDRPYRFSFYSNALSATIHARSLSELPAEGQSFEDLFWGRNPAPQNPIPGARPAVPGRVSSNGSATVAAGLKSTGSSPVFNSMFPGAAAAGPGKGFIGERRLPGDASSDTCTWWLDVLSPTDEEMKLLSKVFSIHPLTTEDIQMEETREKIELFRNYYLVCFRGFDQDQYSPTYLEPLNMYIIVFREGILSFHFRPTPHPQNVRRRIKQLKDYISVTSDWISYALIDDITDAFGPLIQSIEYEVDSIDELVLILKEAEQSDMLRRIGTCRKKVMGLLRLMGNKADVVKGLAKRCNENWRVAPTSDIGLYLSDIQDHLITMTQNLNHYEKILSRSHSNYLAQISIEMTEANNQINDVLSKLTALGTVLIPMNLVTGLWGMNVHVPGQDGTTLTWFGSIIGALAAFAVIAGWSTYKLMVRR
ncbi:cora-domain-containing protein [Wolfiporia cocos MD-104 SS10]|uniref:Cora-domain-containing protein n=1 Tax=Wolfiporia cocos (strain MD-104) TaxID=742152 RepID=A0A2H3JW11_WOLCO|nr:cora-domain-containing protein [Wolfiporia cocos MD-104 SS10]